MTGAVQNGHLRISVTPEMLWRVRSLMELLPDDWANLWRDAIRIDQPGSDAIYLYLVPLRPEDV